MSGHSALRKFRRQDSTSSPGDMARKVLAMSSGEDLPRDELHIRMLERPDDFFDFRKHPRNDAKLIHSESDEERRRHRIARQLAADPDPLMVLVPGIDDVLQRDEHRWIERLVQTRHQAVPTVNGKEILGEI